MWLIAHYIYNYLTFPSCECLYSVEEQFYLLMPFYIVHNWIFFPLMWNFMWFSPTRPHWAELVSKSTCPYICMYVCLCHRETPTSGGRADLWSKIAFLILVWDDTFSKKKGGPIFFWGGVEIFLRAILDPTPKSRVKKNSNTYHTPNFLNLIF